MRTRTIFEALSRVYRGTDWVIPAKRYRQHHTFERELLRRMDERDALVAWHPVSEAPPIDTPLLVLHDDRSARIAGYIHRWTGQLAYCNIEEEWGENAYASRTHWRTMPPPPPGVKYAELTGLYDAEGAK